jgi:uncharacterized phage protein (TIGR02220 family)
MARKRMIDPEFWSDEEIGHWSALARLFYIGLWNFADDEGRFKAHDDLLKAQIFPYDKQIKIDQLKQEVSTKVQWYEAAGSKYGYLRNFLKHQKINRPTESKLPKPPVDDHPQFTDGSMNPHGGLTPNRIEKKRREKKGACELIEKQISEFLEYFNEKTGRNLTLTPERRRIIEQRLATHSLDDLKKAVDNFVQDDWPERHKYMDVIYCIGVRNKIDNLEKWLNYRVKGPPGASKPVDRITNLDKAKRLLERERTTTAMIRCLAELPEADRKELVKWIPAQGLYLKPVYENAQKILKERTARGKT